MEITNTLCNIFFLFKKYYSSEFDTLWNECGVYGNGHIICKCILLKRIIDTGVAYTL